jgi:hypothetical protein
MLINCPECNREVTSTIKRCPHCGYSIKKDSLLAPVAVLVGVVVCAGVWGSMVIPIDSVNTGGMDFSPQASALSPSPVADPAWTPPQGFQAIQTRSPYGESKWVAIRWVPPAEAQCETYMSRCYQLEIVSEKGCSLLYASLIKLDSAGANIGYTNDTTSSVVAEQIARLTFSASGEKTVQIGEINCH